MVLVLVEMICGLVHASYSLPEWQAVKLTFFAPCAPDVFFFPESLLFNTETWMIWTGISPWLQCISYS